MSEQGALFGARASDVLARHHYLGVSARGKLVYHDNSGVLVFSAPASRRLPPSWLELARWCIVDRERNAGSAQWRRAVKWLREQTDATTVVSYSDPSVGHDGALYRASNWLWAPTWHRLRPPPSGLGAWTNGKGQSVKDRWVYPLLPDETRAAVLTLNDESLKRRMPWAEYREPEWRRGVWNARTGGGNYRRWLMEGGHG